MRRNPAVGRNQPLASVPGDRVWLAGRYLTDRLTVPQIAVLTGESEAVVRRALLRTGVAGPGLPAPLLDDPVWLRARYETDQMGPAQIGVLTATSALRVLGALRTHKIMVRSGRNRPPLLEDARWLRARYETDGLTVGQVAVLAGAAQSSVTDAMRRHGIEARKRKKVTPGGPPGAHRTASSLTPEMNDPVWLRARYETDGLTTRQVGELVGVSEGTARSALDRHGVGLRRRRPRQAPAELTDPVWLRARYETDKLTLAQVGALIGASEAMVQRAMARHTIGCPPRSSRPELSDREWLVGRCVTDKMPVVQVAGLLRVPAGTVRAALTRHRIALRPVRPVLLDDPVWLWERYETDGLTLVRVGALVGVSRAKVRAAFAAHGIVCRPVGRTRFPVPAELEDAGWLRARYETDGLTVALVGALVGVSRAKVRAALTRHGIGVRGRV